jgi:hypothetical protein
MKNVVLSGLLIAATALSTIVTASEFSGSAGITNNIISRGLDDHSDAPVFFGRMDYEFHNFRIGMLADTQDVSTENAQLNLNAYGEVFTYFQDHEFKFGVMTNDYVNSSSESEIYWGVAGPTSLGPLRYDLTMSHSNQTSDLFIDTNLLYPVDDLTFKIGTSYMDYRGTRGKSGFEYMTLGVAYEFETPYNFDVEVSAEFINPLGDDIIRGQRADDQFMFSTELKF